MESFKLFYHLVFLFSSFGSQASRCTQTLRYYTRVHAYPEPLENSFRCSWETMCITRYRYHVSQLELCSIVYCIDLPALGSRLETTRSS
ncbi:hypothetical protein ABKN59_010566 [Abortiporus biennis]